MQITSTNFDNLDVIPDKFSRSGDDTNPSLTFSEIPDKTESLALIVEDPDAPNGIFTHWILYNMTPGVLQIVEGELPISGQQGINDYGESGYGGPAPPSGTHRYEFNLFALDTMIVSESPINRSTLYELMDDHIIDRAQITGTYNANS